MCFNVTRVTTYKLIFISEKERNLCYLLIKNRGIRKLLADNSGWLARYVVCWQGIRWEPKSHPCRNFCCRREVEFFFFSVCMWKKRWLKLGTYSPHYSKNWLYHYLVCKFLVDLSLSSSIKSVSVHGQFLIFCQALRPKPQLHYHFSSGLCVSRLDFFVWGKIQKSGKVNTWIH